MLLLRQARSALQENESFQCYIVTPLLDSSIALFSFLTDFVRKVLHFC